MQYVADLHLHSKYSRAVSKDMVLPIMAGWAKKKGIDILATSDWTHPLWLREIRTQLEESVEGLYRLKSQIPNSKSQTNSNVKNQNNQKEPLFLLSVEVSSIYSQGGKLRRIHNLIFAPNFEIAEKINRELVRRGVNLMSDGRPIMGISAKQLLELVLTIDKRVIFIPAHAWTPHFGIFGSASGFDSLDECFGDYSKYIYGIETGLSSDPWMNWQIKELDNRSILSFSDAHSPAKMGREATVFEIDKTRDSLCYMNIGKAIAEPIKKIDGRGLKIEGRSSIHLQSSTIKKPLSTLHHPPSNRVAYTIEFYPEEGKYHYSGHRNCGVVEDPTKVKASNHICRVCGKRLTEGVMYRLGQLSKQISNLKSQISNLDQYGVNWIDDKEYKRPPFVKLVPLNEIIAESLSSTVASEKVKKIFDDLCNQFGSEIEVLLHTSIEKISSQAGEKIAEGVWKVRKGDIVIDPGFDGEYGKVKIWPASPDEQASRGGNEEEKQSQLGLF